MTRAAAYRLTLYRAGRVVVRVGRRSAAADGWMARHGARQAGFITAWNPMSRRRPARWNSAAQARLRRDLRGVPAEPGEGALGGWREEMILAALALPELLRLARRHRQAAVILLRLRRPAALIWTAAAKV